MERVKLAKIDELYGAECKMKPNKNGYVEFRELDFDNLADFVEYGNEGDCWRCDDAVYCKVLINGEVEIFMINAFFEMYKLTNNENEK